MNCRYDARVLDVVHSVWAFGSDAAGLDIIVGDTLPSEVSNLKPVPIFYSIPIIYFKGVLVIHLFIRSRRFNSICPWYV